MAGSAAPSLASDSAAPTGRRRRCGGHAPRRRLLRLLLCASLAGRGWPVWPGPVDPGPPTLSLSLVGGSSLAQLPALGREVNGYSQRIFCSFTSLRPTATPLQRNATCFGRAGQRLRQPSEREDLLKFYARSRSLISGHLWLRPSFVRMIVFLTRIIRAVTEKRHPRCSFLSLLRVLGRHVRSAESVCNFVPNVFT